MNAVPRWLRERETPVELGDVLIVQKLVGRFQGSDIA